MQLEREIKGISQDYIIPWCSWREKSRVLARTILFRGAAGERNQGYYPGLYYSVVQLEREIKGISQDYIIPWCSWREKSRVLARTILFRGAAGERNQGY